jgi:putative peptidoglycan lipid II flippase
MLSRLTGLLRIMMLTYALGVQQSIADAYNLANMVPFMVFEFVAGGFLSAIFIPLIVREQERSGKTSAEAWRIANLLLGCVGAVLAIISLLVFLLSPWILNLLTVMGKHAAGTDRHEMATFFLRFFAPQMFFHGVNSVFMAILNSHNVFAVTGAAPIMNNLVVIGALYLFHMNVIGISGLALGTTLGVAAMALIQIPWLLKLGMPLRPRFNYRDPVFQSAVVLGIPVIVVAVANLMGTGVRTNLLSQVLGGQSAYTICFNLIMMPYGIFAVSIATVMYPALSRSAAGGERARYTSLFSQGLRWTSFVMIPVAVGVSVLALPIVEVLFRHRNGRFQYSDAVLVSDFLRAYAPSIFPYALVMYATRGYYSLKDTRTPAAINVGGVVLNVLLSWTFFNLLGLPGIGLAAGISYFATTTASLIGLSGKMNGIEARRVLTSWIKMAVSAVVMGFAVWSLESATRPVADVVFSGTRLPEMGSRISPNGARILIDNERSWRQLGVALKLTSGTLPSFDFRKERLFLFTGPVDRTTATLRLESAAIGTTNCAELKFALIVARGAAAGTEAKSTVTSPTFAIIRIRHPVDAVNPTTILEDSSGHGLIRLWEKSREILRLVSLILAGAAVFLFTAWLLRVDELKAVVHQVLGRLGRTLPK